MNHERWNRTLDQICSRAAALPRAESEWLILEVNALLMRMVGPLSRHGRAVLNRGTTAGALDLVDELAVTGAGWRAGAQIVRWIDSHWDYADQHESRAIFDWYGQRLDLPGPYSNFIAHADGLHSTEARLIAINWAVFWGSARALDWSLRRWSPTRGGFAAPGLAPAVVTRSAVLGLLQIFRYEIDESKHEAADALVACMHRPDMATSLAQGAASSFLQRPELNFRLTAALRAMTKSALASRSDWSESEFDDILRAMDSLRRDIEGARRFR